MKKNIPTRRGGPGLSARQKATLCQLARRAYDHQADLGLIDAGEDFATWRRAQQRHACGEESLRACTNKHYRSIRGHWHAILGIGDGGYRDMTQTGPVRAHGDHTDTHENRERYLHLIEAALADHNARAADPAHPAYPAIHDRGGPIGHGYLASLAQGKFRGRAVGSLDAGQLYQLLATLRNRIASREGRGKKTARNKSQRRPA